MPLADLTDVLDGFSRLFFPISVLTLLYLVLNHLLLAAQHLGQGRGDSRSMGPFVLELFDCNF